MAGRPRKMVAKVEEFEKLAIMLAMDVFEIVPKQYLDTPNPEDPISQAWKEAVDTTMWATIAMETLGNRLRAKAGITRPGPSEEFWSNPPEDAELVPVPAGEG